MTDEDAPQLGLATTEELLAEVAVRMEVTQNSLNGRELGSLCREALERLDPGVLRYRSTNTLLLKQESRGLDMSDPDIREMARHHHTPVEHWSNTGTLMGVNCDMCSNSWPCATVTALRRFQ